MLNGKYVSIDFIMERLNRNSILFKKANLSASDLAEYVGDAILLIGAKPQYQDNFALIDIKEHRGLLPCHPTSIESFRAVDTGIGLRGSTDTFAGSPNKSKVNNYFLGDADYVIKGNIIHTDSIKEGQVEVKYQSLITDDNGLPMIPDNERSIRAIESYVKFMVYRPMWEIGEIRDAVFQQAEQDWLFYVNSAKTKALMPNIDMMESIKNAVVKLYRPHNTRNDTGRALGNQERRRLHNGR